MPWQKFLLSRSNFSHQFLSFAQLERCEFGGEEEKVPMENVPFHPQLI